MFIILGESKIEVGVTTFMLNGCLSIVGVDENISALESFVIASKVIGLLCVYSFSSVEEEYRRVDAWEAERC